jgi:hypothetical protein
MTQPPKPVRLAGIPAAAGNNSVMANPGRCLSARPSFGERLPNIDEPTRAPGFTGSHSVSPGRAPNPPCRSPGSGLSKQGLVIFDHPYNAEYARR